MDRKTDGYTLTLHAGLPAVSACRAGLFIALTSVWYELVGSLVLISGPDIDVDGSDVLPAV